MADLLNTGVSALLAYRAALDTAGHNIANANTPGFSRQRVELVSRLGQGSGDGYIGSGVNAATVRRLTDNFVGQRLIADHAAHARAGSVSDITTRLDALLSDPATGVAQPLNALFEGINAVAANPASVASRQSLIASGQNLATRLQALNGEIESLQAEISGRVRQEVDQINGLAGGIAALNERIALARGAAGGQPPNDLLDQRDQLVQQLAGKVGISTVQADDGSLNVFTGSGQALVLGKQSNALSVADDAFGSGRVELRFNGADITGQIGGGSLGGLLDARSEVLDPAQAGLGRIAVAVASSVNQQHARGLDADGQLGGDFFAPAAGSTLASRNNTGSAAVAVGFTNLALLGSEEYELRFDGASFALSSAASGAGVALSGSGTVADPFLAAGLSFTVSGTAAAGDRFLLRPTAAAAGAIRVSISDPARIAAASPLRTAANVANAGSGQISAATVTDIANPALLDDVEIRFTAPGSYSINGSGSFAYSDGQSIVVNGFTVALNGVPAVGDRFSVSANAANSSDNGNARALAAVGRLGVLDGGRNTLVTAQAALVAGVGNQARQADVAVQTQAALLSQAQAQRDAVSGVSLDEEASDLVRFQQAYQAAAQVIAVADAVFQSLLDAARR